MSHDTFAFTHLSLQEYLGASAFAALLDKNPLEGLKLFCRAYHNPTVVEMQVLPMTLALTAKADELYSEIDRWPESPTFAGLRLRGRALTYKVTISDHVLSATLDRIAQLLIKSTNEEEAYRRIILRSLAGIRGRAREYLEEQIIPSLSRHSGFEDQRAAEALASIGTSKSVEPLIRALDPHAIERGYVTTSIGRLDDQRVNYICRALTRIAPEKAVPVLASISTIYSYGEIDRLLKEIGTEDAFRGLLYRKSKTMDWMSSDAARKLFHESESAGVVATLRRALTNSNAEFRSVAVETLGTWG